MSPVIQDPYHRHPIFIQPKPVDQSYTPILSTTIFIPPPSVIDSPYPPILYDDDLSHKKDDISLPLIPSDAIMRYDEAWQVSICRKYQIGVHGNTLIRHLKERLHRYRKD